MPSHPECHITFTWPYFTGFACDNVFSTKSLKEFMKHINVFVLASFGMVNAAFSESRTDPLLGKWTLSPGKWTLSSTMENAFTGRVSETIDRCITQKDLDEGQILKSKSATSMDCTYSDLKQTGNRYQYIATCRSPNMQEPVTTTYDVTFSQTQLEGKVSSTGGVVKTKGDKGSFKLPDSNITSSGKRTGGC